jgi:hypothetical protein
MNSFIGFMETNCDLSAQFYLEIIDNFLPEIQFRIAGGLTALVGHLLSHPHILTRNQLPEDK